jgi:hypothetical protein
LLGGHKKADFTVFLEHFGGNDHEKDLSTQCLEAQADPWFQSAYADCRRARGDQPPSREGTHPVECLRVGDRIWIRHATLSRKRIDC